RWIAGARLAPSQADPALSRRPGVGPAPDAPAPARLEAGPSPGGRIQAEPEPPDAGVPRPLPEPLGRRCGRPVPGRDPFPELGRALGPSDRAARRRPRQGRRLSVRALSDPDGGEWAGMRICLISVEIFAWGKYGGFGRATRTI